MDQTLKLAFTLLLLSILTLQSKAQEYGYQKIPLPKDLKSRKISHVFQDMAGAFWLSSGKDLYKYTRRTFINYGKEQDLKLSRITGIGETSDSTICVTTYGSGMYFFKGNSHKQLNLKNGLPNEFCNKLYIDDNDNIWVGTNFGLAKIRLTSKDNFELKPFFKHSGLPGNKVIDVYNKGDRLWIVTSTGSTAYIQRKMEFNMTPMDVAISKVRIDGIDTLLQKKYELPSDETSIQIFYGVRNKNFRGLVNYRYKLVGVDSNWTHTSQTSILYPGLKSKSYTFMVNAQNQDGFWSNNPATVTIIVKLPFYETWWFQAFWINIIGAGLILIYFFRIKQIRKREEEKTRLNKQISEIELKALRAQMNPHFIFNSLNSIQHFITNNDGESANKYLSKFAKLMRMILEGSKKPTISVTDEIKALSFYMELESLRFENKFNYDIKLDPAIDIHNTDIPTMLIQPYVENAIWHGLMNKSRKGMININLKLEEEALHCIIEDNGIGREKARELKKQNFNEHKSIGMQVTQERLEILNTLQKKETNINITDLKDEEGKAIGTKVEIYIPIL